MDNLPKSSLANIRKWARNQLAWSIHRTRRGNSYPEYDYAKACDRADAILADIDFYPDVEMALFTYLQSKRGDNVDGH